MKKGTGLGLILCVEIVLGMLAGFCFCKALTDYQRTENDMLEEFTVPLEKSYISFKGYYIPYTDTYGKNSSPDYGAGIFAGSASTTDNSWGAFAAHNVGAFTPLLEVEPNDIITVCDDDGNFLAYKVTNVYEIAYTENMWEDTVKICGLEEKDGERIVLRTCISGGDGRRVVLAWALS